jgi:hypothetical protein
MKRVTLFIITLIFLAGAKSQNCINCFNNTINSVDYSSALGEENTSTGLSSFASGKLNQATGWFTTALGYGNISSGVSAFSAGVYNSMTGAYSIGIGNYLQATQSRSFIIGSGSGLNSPLINNKPNSLMIGFGSVNPTFFVSGAPGGNKTGSIGVGNITDPQAKIHIKLDLTEKTAIRIEPYAWMYENWAEIQFGNEQYAIRGTHNKGLGFYSPYSFVFNTGNVGIGISNPSEKLEISGNLKTGGSIRTGGDIFIEDISKGIIMKSPNGQCWRTTVSDDGTFVLNQVDCLGLVTTTQQAGTINAEAINIFPNPTTGALTIETGQEMYNGRVSIFSSEGRQLYSEQMHGITAKIDLRHLQPGVYIVNVEGGGRIIKSQQVVLK